MIILIEIHCPDRFNFQLIDQGKTVAEGNQTYVPDWFMPNHYGDGFKMRIDTVTGKILNWTHPTSGQLQSTVDEYNI